MPEGTPFTISKRCSFCFPPGYAQRAYRERRPFWDLLIEYLKFYNVKSRREHRFLSQLPWAGLGSLFRLEIHWKFYWYLGQPQPSQRWGTLFHHESQCLSDALLRLM